MFFFMSKSPSVVFNIHTKHESNRLIFHLIRLRYSSFFHEYISIKTKQKLVEKNKRHASVHVSMFSDARQFRCFSTHP